MAEETGWYFTFGAGQPHEGCYHYVAEPDYMKARDYMINSFGRQWCGQYKTAEDAGVEKWGMKEIK